MNYGKGWIPGYARWNESGFHAQAGSEDAAGDAADAGEQEAKTFTAKAGGGMVSATVNGKHELVSMEINPEAVDPDDVEMLQDMVIAAVNEAMRAADSEAANNMSRLTGGLNLGGLF